MQTLCPSRHQLHDFTLGQVAEPFGLEVEEHLSHCSDCLATLDDLRPTDTLLEAVQVHELSLLKLPSDHAIQQVIQQLKHITAGETNKDNRELALTQLWSMLPGGQRQNELARIGSYRILKVLGCGGMGVVLLGEDMQLNRRVAVKVLSPLLAGRDSARKRFLREAQATASINHPNIVAIHHVGEENGLPYFVMPYLEGESLEARLKREAPLPSADIVRIGRELADGLAAAHERGLLHRDVKPANIFLAPKKLENSIGRDSPDLHPAADVCSTAVLLDFGLSWVADGGERLTEHGTIIGTPPFMSPEQARGDSVDARSDLFALGSVLYSMCTAQSPFAGDSVYTILEEVRTARPRPVRELNPAIPPQLAGIINKLHEKDAAQRYQNATEVARALAQVPLSSSEGDSKVHRFRFRAIVALVACLGLGLAGLLAANIGTPQIAVSNPRSAISGQRSAVSDQPAAGSGQQSANGNQKSAGSQTVPAKDLVVPIVPKDSVAPVQVAAAAPQAEPKEEPVPGFYPVAMFPFEERGIAVKDFGTKIVDLLYARLAVKPEIYLVDRADIKKILSELELNISGVVKASEANKIGQLSGAKLLISGSVFTIDKQTYVVARIVGTETSRILVASANGKSADELAPLIEKLGDQIADKIKEQGHTIVPKAATKEDRLTSLKKIMKKGERPVVMVQIAERQVGATPIDPAAQTEVMRFCKDAGFTVLDPELGLRSKAEVLILGEALSEVASRNGNLVSVRARVELRAVDRATDKVLAADRQTALVVDLTEQIAGKSAIEEAAAILAERILPKLVKE